MSSALNQMDSQSEKDKFEAVTSQAEDFGTENVLENELNVVAGLLADSRPQRSRALTEKGLSYWMETRDLRRKNQDRYREIIEGHVERIYDNIKTGEGTNSIEESLANITRSYQDYTRQFDSLEEQMSDPLFLQTFNKVKAVQQEVQSWKINQQAISFSRRKPSSIISEGSKRTRKSKSSKSSHSSSRTMNDIIRNRTKLVELQARAQYFEKERHVELELDRTRLEKEIAIAKATEKIHREYLNDDYELNSLNDKDIPIPKISHDAMTYSHERKPTVSHFPDVYANTEKQSFLAVNDQRSHMAPIFSTQARHNPVKVNLQPQATPFYPAVVPGAATISVPDPIPPPGLIPGPAPTSHLAPSSNHGNEMLYHLLEKQGEYLRRQGLPSVTPEIFTGDTLNYKIFTTLFDMAVDSRISDPREKLALLIEFTSGEPKNLIETCLYQSPESGYRRARELLEKHYGNPIQVANTHMEKLVSWPKVYDSDSKKMRE